MIFSFFFICVSVVEKFCVVFGASFELYTAVWLSTSFFRDVTPRLCLVVWDFSKAISGLPLILGLEPVSQW